MRELTKINNEQAINEITLYPVVFTKCEIGGDWYENRLEVVFMPSKYYPDYTEVQTWIMENLDGCTLNIEDVVSKLFEFFLLYEPQALTVTDHIIDCKTHFAVDVKKEGEFNHV